MKHTSRKKPAVIRPNAQTQAKRDGADSSYTDKYLTWEKYSTYATAAQSNSVTFNYTLATSVPVRESKSLQAIAAKNDTNERQDRRQPDPAGVLHVRRCSSTTTAIG